MARPEALLLLLTQFKPVQCLVNLFQLVPISGPEITSTRQLCHLRQRVLIQLLGTAAKQAPASGSPHTDGIDTQPGCRRITGRRHRVGLPRRVTTIRQQDQYPLPLIVTQPLDRQANGIPQGRALAQKTDLRLIQQQAHRLPVPGQWRLQEGLVPEQYQTDTVRIPPGDKIACHLLYRLQSIGPPQSRQTHVPLLHTPGDIHGQHQVSACHRQGHRLTQPLRATGGPDQGDPGQHGQPQFQPEPDRLTRALQRHKIGGEGHPQYRRMLLHRRQQPAYQQRQRQGQGGPRPGPFKGAVHGYRAAACATIIHTIRSTPPCCVAVPVDGTGQLPAGAPVRR